MAGQKPILLHSLSCEAINNAVHSFSSLIFQFCSLNPTCKVGYQTTEYHQQEYKFIAKGNQNNTGSAHNLLPSAFFFFSRIVAAITQHYFLSNNHFSSCSNLPCMFRPLLYIIYYSLTQRFKAIIHEDSQKPLHFLLSDRAGKFQQVFFLRSSLKFPTMFLLLIHLFLAFNLSKVICMLRYVTRKCM